MNLLFWGLTLGVIGKVLLGIAVMMVHWRIVKEHRIDRVVLKEMRRERNVAFLGIVFIVIGYLLELFFYGYVPGFESPFSESALLFMSVEFPVACCGGENATKGGRGKL